MQRQNRSATTRPQTTVPRETAGALQCNTQYEFQVEVQLSDGWKNYGEFTASTGSLLNRAQSCRLGASNSLYRLLPESSSRR